MEPITSMLKKYIIGYIETLFWSLTTKLICLYVVRGRRVRLIHHLTIFDSTKFFKCNFMLFNGRNVKYYKYLSLKKWCLPIFSIYCK